MAGSVGFMDEQVGMRIGFGRHADVALGRFPGWVCARRGSMMIVGPTRFAGELGGRYTRLEYLGVKRAARMGLCKAESRERLKE
jgi:hypothetical protein